MTERCMGCMEYWEIEYIDSLGYCPNCRDLTENGLTNFNPQQRLTIKQIKDAAAKLKSMATGTPSYDWVQQWNFSFQTSTSTGQSFPATAPYFFLPQGITLGTPPSSNDEADSGLIAKPQTILEFKERLENKVLTAFNTMSHAEQLLLYRLMNAHGLRMHSIDSDVSRALRKEWDELNKAT